MRRLIQGDDSDSGGEEPRRRAVDRGAAAASLSATHGHPPPNSIASLVKLSIAFSLVSVAATLLAVQASIQGSPLRQLQAPATARVSDRSWFTSGRKGGVSFAAPVTVSALPKHPARKRPADDQDYNTIDNATNGWNDMKIVVSSDKRLSADLRHHMRLLHLHSMRALAAFNVTVVPVTDLQGDYGQERGQGWQHAAEQILARGRAQPDWGLQQIGGVPLRARLVVRQEGANASVAIFRNATVSAWGDIFTHGADQCRGCSFYLKGCKLESWATLSPVKFRVPAGGGETQEHDSLVTVSHRHLGLYHFLIEGLSRLPMVAALLASHPETVLHVGRLETAKQGGGQQYKMPSGLWESFQLPLLEVFGVEARRVVFGIQRARIVYVPEPETCFVQTPLLMRSFQSLFRGRLAAASSSLLSMPSPTKPCSVVVIDRASQGLKGGHARQARVVRNHAALVEAVRQAAAPVGCAVEEQRENQTLMDQLSLFYFASAVVAPHGAALANLVACEKGTAVLEFLNSKGALSLCFMHIALACGLRYEARVIAGAHHDGAMIIPQDILRYSGVFVEQHLYVQHLRTSMRTNQSHAGLR